MCAYGGRKIVYDSLEKETLPFDLALKFREVEKGVTLKLEGCEGCYFKVNEYRKALLQSYEVQKSANLK